VRSGVDRLGRRAALLGALALVWLSGALLARAEEGAHSAAGPFRHVRVVDFDGEIEPVIYAYVARQVEAARAAGVDCLVLRIESPGGTVYHSEKIGDLLVGLPEGIHTIAWVPKAAYSGAAMVALSCREIVMGAAAHLGDAQPGTISPTEGWTPVGEKAESPLRAKFREYAQKNGYPVPLAEAMVSERIEVLRVRDPAGRDHFVKGEDFRSAAPEAVLVAGFARRDLVQEGPPVVRSGELLTMTAEEAARYGFLGRRFADGQPFPPTEAALLAALSAEGGQVEQVAMGFSEEASRVLMTIAGVLSAIVALSVLVLLWQGPGLMTIVGGIALVLVILINATADQLNGFPLFLLLVGFLLLAAEVFVIPGFGVAGILGIASFGAGFLMLAGGATIGDPGALDAGSAVDFGLQFVFTVLAGMALLFTLSRFLPRVGPARRMILAAPSARPQPTEIPSSTSPLLHRRGLAVSDLRPAGTAEIDGLLTDVTSEGGYVPAGAEVVVVGVEGNLVSVRPAGPAAKES
jgi:membrane-bound serine protease (ClpP class)